MPGLHNPPPPKVVEDWSSINILIGCLSVFLVILVFTALIFWIVGRVYRDEQNWVAQTSTNVRKIVELKRGTTRQPRYDPPSDSIYSPMPPTPTLKKIVPLKLYNGTLYPKTEIDRMNHFFTESRYPYIPEPYDSQKRHDKLERVMQKQAMRRFKVRWAEVHAQFRKDVEDGKIVKVAADEPPKPARRVDEGISMGTAQSSGPASTAPSILITPLQEQATLHSSFGGENTPIVPQRPPPAYQGAQKAKQASVGNEDSERITGTDADRC